MRDAILFLLLLGGLNLISLHAQDQAAFSCGSATAASEVSQLADEAAYQNLWRDYQAEALQSGPQAKSLNPTYRLPAVIHVIHDCAPVGTQDRNPSEDYLKSILAQANLRFRQQQAGAPTFSNPLYGPDTEIEVCLATQDPNGGYTTGIVRHNDGALASSDNWVQQVIDLDAIYGWPSDQYLNIFLVENTNTAGGYAGAGRLLIRTGIYNAGLINHEVGHYLGLAHPFASSNCDNGNCLVDGDGICDTPPKASPGTLGASNCNGNSCTTDEDDSSTNNPYRSVALGGVGDQPDMLYNYMDYTGSCWDAFSVGQKARMHATIQNLWSTNNAAAATLCAPSTTTNQLVLENVTYEVDGCQGQLSVTFTLRNGGSNQANSCTTVLNLNGQQYNDNFSFSLSPGSTTTLSTNVPLPSAGEYAGTFTVDQVNNTNDTYPNDNETCLSVAVLGDSYPYGSDFNSCTFPTGMTFNSTNDDQVGLGAFSTNGLNNCRGCSMIYVGFNQQAQTVNICLPNTDLSSLNNPELALTYGHIPRYNFISNALSVVFTNCDGSEDVLWSASGLSLGTNDPPAYVDPGGGGALPTCDEFNTVLVPIPAANEEGEICFRLVGRYYSRILIDGFEVRGAALPLDLEGFTAQPAPKHNQLNWTTSYEEDLETFLLERSLDGGRHFTAIAEIPAQNQLMGSEYQYEDLTPDLLQHTTVYYRLRSRDYDGSESLFGPILVQREFSEGWSVGPNPLMAGGDLRIQGPAAMAELYDLNGRQVRHWRTTADAVTAGLTPGVYLLRLKALAGKEMVTRRVVVW